MRVDGSLDIWRDICLFRRQPLLPGLMDFTRVFQSFFRMALEMVLILVDFVQRQCSLFSTRVSRRVQVGVSLRAAARVAFALQALDTLASPVGSDLVSAAQ